MAPLFTRAASGVTREIRGETLVFYPVRVWSVWSKHLRMLGGLLSGVSELISVFASKPKGETVSSESLDQGTFYSSKPADPKAVEAWSKRLAAAIDKIVAEAAKEGIIEAFCLTVLESLRRPATPEAAKELAEELDTDLLVELGTGLFSASLQTLSTPLKAMVESVRTRVLKPFENSLSGSPESVESESLTS